MYAVVYFDRLEYQSHPVFHDRDAGEIYAWETMHEALINCAGLYQAQVVDASTLPFKAFNCSAAMREAVQFMKESQ
jgi:hypothetical protein